MVFSLSCFLHNVIRSTSKKKKKLFIAARNDILHVTRLLMDTVFLIMFVRRNGKNIQCLRSFQRLQTKKPTNCLRLLIQALVEFMHNKGRQHCGSSAKLYCSAVHRGCRACFIQLPISESIAKIKKNWRP